MLLQITIILKISTEIPDWEKNILLSFIVNGSQLAKRKKVDFLHVPAM